MTLTTKQLRRAAREARKLAYEYVEGRGPALQAWTWCGCAAAEIVKRAGIAVPKSDLDPRVGSAARELEFVTAGFEHSLLTWGTNREVQGTPGALVFPLLYAADRLENAARKSRPQKNVQP